MTVAARAETEAAELGVGTAYTLLAAMGYAAVSTLTSLATAEHVSLFTVLAWRYTLAAAVLASYVGARTFPRMPWHEAVRFIVVGGGGQALLVGMALSSLRWIGVATLAFLFYTYPAWVTLVQTVRGAERPTVRRLVALALSFGGTIVMVGAPSGARLPWQGVGLALGAAMTYGLYIPTIQYLQKNHRVTVTSAYSKVGSALCFLVLAVGNQSFTASLPVRAWEAVVALALFSTVLPGVLFIMGLLRLGPVRTAIVSTVEPFLTAVLGAVVLGQALRGDTLLGGAMIVAAVVLLQFRRERVA